MKEIKLTHGKVALVDDEDYEWINKYTWCLLLTGYAGSASMIWEYKTRGIALMHRVILNVPKNQIIDHINRNKLDNRKSNLRIADPTGNNANKGLQTNNTLGYKGLKLKFYKDGTPKYEVIVRHKNIKHYIGVFKSKEEAALAYNEAAIKYFGEYACLNKI